MNLITIFIHNDNDYELISVNTIIDVLYLLPFVVDSCCSTKLGFCGKSDLYILLGYLLLIDLVTVVGSHSSILLFSQSNKIVDII